MWKLWISLFSGAMAPFSMWANMWGIWRIKRAGCVHHKFYLLFIHSSAAIDTPMFSVIHILPPAGVDGAPRRVSAHRAHREKKRAGVKPALRKDAAHLCDCHLFDTARQL